MGRVLTGMIAAAYVTDNPAGVARDGAHGTYHRRPLVPPLVRGPGRHGQTRRDRREPVARRGESVRDRGALAVHAPMLEVRIAPAAEWMKEHT